jgi:NADH dehydrogenase
MGDVHCVTGAFGFSGRFIARRLIEAGHRVRTLTGSRARPEGLAESVRVCPLDFTDADGLRRDLDGVRVLYNTYWVRFSAAGFSQEAAVQNTLALFEAARDAGVQRVVHVSITNPSEQSPYEYFRGKARLEALLAETGLAHTILRPAVLFGVDDILVNNIAWMLRRLPVFGVFGDGRYRLQPIHVEDFADLAVEAGRHTGNEIVQAIGPETWSYRELVQMLGQAIDRRRPVVSVPRWLGLAVAKVAGLFLRDVVLTGPEVDALMDDLLAVDAPPAGTTRLSQWAREHAGSLGRRYASELARRR